MKIANIMKQAYGLKRNVTDAEVLMEKYTMTRKSAQGTLDDFSERLYLAMLRESDPLMTPADHAEVEKFFAFFANNDSGVRSIMLKIVGKKFTLTEEQAEWWYDRWQHSIAFSELPM